MRLGHELVLHPPDGKRKPRLTSIMLNDGKPDLAAIVYWKLHGIRISKLAHLPAERQDLVNPDSFHGCWLDTPHDLGYADLIRRTINMPVYNIRSTASAKQGDAHVWINALNAQVTIKNEALELNGWVPQIGPYCGLLWGFIP